MKKKAKSIKNKKSKKIWVKLLVALGVVGIVVACTLLPIYSCSGKNNQVTGKATFNDKKNNIVAYTETDVATVAFADVENTDDVSYEFTSTEENFIHLEHVFKDDKHYITAKSKPLVSATPKKVDVTVKALINRTVIGEMSQAIEITGQPITNSVQPSDFSHTAGDSVETICSFDIPPVYKDVFKSYKAVALDATSGSTDSNYTIEQKTIVGNAVSFKLTSNVNLQDEVKQLKISVVGVYDWQGVEDNVSLFESSSFTATITHYQEPAVLVDFVSYTFESNEVALMAKLRLTNIVSPEKNLSFVLKGDDSGFFKLRYAFIDGEHCIESKSVPVTNSDKSLIGVQIFTFYNGNEVGSSVLTSIALKKLDMELSPISNFTGAGGSTNKDYIKLNVGEATGAQSITDNKVETYLSPDGVKLDTYLITETPPQSRLKQYSVTLPVVTEDITQMIYFVVSGNYVNFDGKTETIELARTEVVSVTTTKA